MKLHCVYSYFRYFRCSAVVRLEVEASKSDSGISAVHKQHYREMVCKNKSEKSIFPLFWWTVELRERDGDTERRQRRETRHIDLNGFSPYITVRSTLQPPLEREHVVNSSSSSQSLQSDFTLIG